MDKLATEAVDTRPVSLVVTSAMMFFLIISSTAWMILQGTNSALPFAGKLLWAAAGLVFLWFYWNGYSWTRYLVLAIGILALFGGAFGPRAIFSSFRFSADANIREYLNLLWVCLDIYLFCWLLTPVGKKYFTTEARHERKSLKSFRKLESSLPL